MSLYETLKADYKTAFRAKEQFTKETLKYIIWIVKMKEIDNRWIEIKDDDIIAIIKKEIKAREDASGNYKKMWNQEEIDIQMKNIEIIKQYLPEMLSEEALKKIIDTKVAELGLELPAQKGQLMWAIMKEYRSVVDPAMLNKLI